ncbi:MAG: transposase, partial [Myxococcota bacterium]
KVIRGAITKCRERNGGRVVQWSVQRDHIHLLVEAHGAPALAKAMQGLSVCIARRLNKALGRRGPAFQDRYHAHILKTPREVRHALAYVLNNARRHAAQRGLRLPRAFVDPCSSAAHFDGWKSPPKVPEHDSSGGARVAEGRPAEGRPAPTRREHLPRAIPPPVAAPRTWLLSTGWRRHGLISSSETPGR